MVTRTPALLQRRGLGLVFRFVRIGKVSDRDILYERGTVHGTAWAWAWQWHGSKVKWNGMSETWCGSSRDLRQKAEEIESA